MMLSVPTAWAAGAAGDGFQVERSGWRRNRRASRKQSEAWLRPGDNKTHGQDSISESRRANSTNAYPPPRPARVLFITHPGLRHSVPNKIRNMMAMVTRDGCRPVMLVSKNPYSPGYCQAETFKLGSNRQMLRRNTEFLLIKHRFCPPATKRPPQRPQQCLDKKKRGAEPLAFSKRNLAF